MMQSHSTQRNNDSLKEGRNNKILFLTYHIWPKTTHSTGHITEWMGIRDPCRLCLQPCLINGGNKSEYSKS